ncbi:NADH:ubiquinone oxidoreductase subunit 39 [Nomia melanderi]|uniref:NADH:ubiquinone oxidoreductase subunit 39 n=1 Tax=Nomia melanderi TaxID=2448451 RepID=UPI0013040EE4|nr:NADH dehydrogenase [ubiquinone] 1 alpha subcomplex subunit 9, mitochondrial [Nomia melanderi]
MAAWIPKIAVRATKNQYAYAATQTIQCRDCTNQPRIIKNPTTASLKRGTGGRSSFNGVVCTVFGASGFIGRTVCNRLGKIGTQLIIPHRCDPYYVLPLKLCGDLGQVLFHPFHLKDEDSIIKSIKYSNVVINLIGSNFETRNFSYHDVHVEGARTIAKLARECGVERLIHVSSLNVDPKPEPRVLSGGSQILKTKWHGECAVKKEFPNATIVRPAEVYGQKDWFLTHYMSPLRRFINDTVPLWEKGLKTEKQPVHCSDVGAGIVALVRDPSTAGKTYQFVGPKRYTLHEIVKWLYILAARGVVDAAHQVSDMKYNFLFQTQVSLNDLIYNIYPEMPVTWELIEKYHATDVVYPDLPTLEDLGITPVDMESRMAWEIVPYRFHNEYMETVGEFSKAPPPKTVPLH